MLVVVCRVCLAETMHWQTKKLRSNGAWLAVCLLYTAARLNFLL